MENPITLDYIRERIDFENGDGFHRNINTKEYVFTKNRSFILFNMRNIDGVVVCIINYIYYENYKDLLTIMAFAANFWMGNKVRFLSFAEKAKKISAIKFLKALGFKEDQENHPDWQYPFDCVKHGANCTCIKYMMYK